jgi:hypothetical protein
LRLDQPIEAAFADDDAPIEVVFGTAMKMREKSMGISPIIIIGMHRSGTTMLSRQLEALGVFMGKQKDSNHEATFFLGIDEWLMGQCGGSWDNPQAIRYLLENKRVRAHVSDYIRRYLLSTPRTISYLGWRGYIRHRSLFNLDIPWGWKSPMSTFTLPIWLDLMPDAKIIHIYRHGVDVANSLRQRNRSGWTLTPFQRLYYKWPPLHAIRPKIGEFIRLRCDSLEGGLTLWEEYVAEARSHVHALGEERALELKYETLLGEPEEALNKIIRFCGLPVSGEDLKRVGTLVRKERAYAYREKPDLRAFADRVPERLAGYGY